MSVVIVGGQSIYGGTFWTSFILVYVSTTGLVACANAGTPHSNGSQFFMTFDRCEWLDRKNTIFGKVTGDSIYNLIRIGEEVETDGDDRPLDPAPKITSSIEVIWNLMVPREIFKKLAEPEPAVDNESKSKKKPVKKLKLLSFGEEAEEEQMDLGAVKQKIKSSHDVLDDPRLLKEEDASKEMNLDEQKHARDLQLSVREASSSKKEVLRKDAADESRRLSDSDDNDDDEAGFGA